MEPGREMTITVRQALPDDAKYLLEFTREDQWDYSAYDYQAAVNIDPGFLFVAVDTSNKPVGFGGVIKSSPDTAYIDAYIVRADLRRKGIGSQIWKAMLACVGQNNACLDGRLDLTEWYKRQGFIYESYITHCYSAVITSELKCHLQSPYEVVHYSDSLWPALIEYDRQVYPHFNREKILRAWFHDATTVVALLDGNVVGYGSIHQKNENDYGIRNVYGDNEVVAETILRYLWSSLSNGSIIHFVMIEGKTMSIFRTSLKAFGACKRMYTKAEIKINIDKIWMHSHTKI